MANAIAVPVAVLPYLFLEAQYVFHGQRPDSAWDTRWVGILCVAISFAVLFSANWWASNDLQKLGRGVFSFVMAVVVMAVGALPTLFLLYWFHFAIGGSE